MKNFLFEILVQEMPYKFIASGLEQLKASFKTLFSENNLNYKEIKGYATPRRLTIVVEELETAQADITKDVKGPILKVAVDNNGKYTMAAIGFAKKNGVTENELFEKEGYIWANVHKKGKLTKEILEEILPYLNIYPDEELQPEENEPEGNEPEGNEPEGGQEPE